MRILRSSTLVLMLSGCSIAALSTQAYAQVSIGVSVNTAPPPLPLYEQPPLPGEGFIWVPGYWAWDQPQADYFWVPATWVQPPETNLLWTPGYWGWNNGSFVFYRGYWAPQVGFYGGINYGYGYTGSGYEGGRWENGAFFYNSAVNNIGSVGVKNVYNQTIVVNDTTNNVSYNGGKGGIEARATPQEQAAVKQSRVEATPLQTQHVTNATGEPKVEPVKAESKAEPVKPEPIKAEPKAEPAKLETVKAESKAEPVKLEPMMVEPKAEQRKPELKAEAPRPPAPKPAAAKTEPKPEESQVK